MKNIFSKLFKLTSLEIIAALIFLTACGASQEELDATATKESSFRIGR